MQGEGRSQGFFNPSILSDILINRKESHNRHYRRSANVETEMKKKRKVICSRQKMYDRINTVLGLTLTDTKETVYQTRLRKMSLDDPAEVKEKLCEKLSRYQVLLEREYELRSRLLRTHSLDQQCLSCCDCGKKLSSVRMTSPKIIRSKSESLKMSAANENTKYVLRKQLSVDNIQTTNAVQLRKMVAKEKFAKRRASLLSLEEDFKKVTTILQRERSVDGNNSSVQGARRVDEGIDVTRHLASLAEYSTVTPETLYV